MRRSGSKLADFGGKLTSGGQKLESAGQNLLSHASGDSSGFGSVISKAFGRGLQITGKVFGQGGRVVETAGKHLHTTANLHEDADHHGAGLLKGLHPDAKTSGHHGGGSSPRSGRGGTGTRTASARGHLGNNPRQHAIPNGKRCTGGDPVDMATGDVLLTETDLDLPAALPLVLSRTHLSSYRVGRLFGASWASTLDQRLEIDEHGVVFVAEDGMLLSYPTPVGEGAVLPVEGPRWPLLRSEHGYEVHDPETGRTLHFDGDTAVPVLTALTDRAANRIDIDHDSAGIPVRVRHSGGYHLDIRSHDGLITELVLPGETDTVVRRFGYDEQRRLVEIVNGSGLPLQLDYDTEGRLTRWTDRNDRSYRYAYDAAGRCVRGESPDGFLSYTFDYDRENLVTTATDSLGHATRYHLNDALQITAITDPLGGQTRSEFDPYDRPLSQTDQLGQTTRYEYTEAGDLARITRPDGTQVLAEYNDLHLPVLIVDPDGAVLRQEFTEAGLLAASVDPDGAVTRYHYDQRHRLAAIVEPLGATTHYVCDAAGLPIEVTDPTGATTRYQRDHLGRITAITDPAGGVATLGWTTQSQLAWRRFPDGATERWSYDGEGNQVDYTDPLGGITRTEYGPFDQPLAHIDPTGARTAFAYDTELRLTSVTNPAGLIWRYDYDPAGNLIAETDFNGAHHQLRRDAAGRLAARTNSLGQTTTYSYDLLGQVTEHRAEDHHARFTYDPAGRLARATTADTDLVFTRDALGRVTAETCNGRTLATGYDAAGRRTRRVTPTGVVSQWDYDIAGRAVALHTGGHTLAFGYDPVGREVTRQLGQVTLTQTWDTNHRLHTQALTAPGPAGQAQLRQRRAWTYRADGGVTNVIDQLAGIRHYDLDALGRATSAQAPGHREDYTYDPSGTLTAGTWPDPDEHGATGPRTVTGTLIHGAGRVRFEHDPQGRLVTRQVRTLSGQQRVWRYQWNSQDRLVGLTTPDGIVWRYTYDALGRRVSKQRLGAAGEITEEVVFTWDAANLAEQTSTTGHTLAWDYQPGTFTPLTQIERASHESSQQWVDRRFFAIVSDLVGTPCELVDPTGEIAWRPSTTLWGAQLAPGGQQAWCPLRFPGQYHDLESGQNYNYHRYYNPEDATYTSPDPLGLDGGPNPHAYVANPTGWIDPLGLMSCQDEEFPVPHGNIVYRNLHPGEDPTKGLVAKNPNATYHPAGHLSSGSRPGWASQYISTTKDRDVAEKWYTGRMVAIDLNKFHGKVIDVSTPEAQAAADVRGSSPRRVASNSKEVLLVGRVPPEAITWVKRRR
ncbi:RHS repeat-associated protein [Kutzneria viridogrisea]|uniref:RHS repeat-associated protein n=1 Tax=Kutzneria viridogrisea TaxID=47990 RepID=A0ABR6BJE0_9PSEU|nr:RHS repeat-associated protein [Kutzneria viridogrisea]